MPDEPAPVEKALALLVYAPLGFALYARDTLPGLVGVFAARGRRELQSGGGGVERTVEQARTISETVIGVASSTDVRQRVEETIGVARDVASGAFGSLLAWRGAAAPSSPSTAAAPSTAPAPATTPPAPEAVVVITEVVTVEPTLDAGPHGGLAIPDYDELSASQVVDRLEGLTEAELDAIRVYEIANRGRNTILGKIAQLTR